MNENAEHSAAAHPEVAPPVKSRGDLRQKALTEELSQLVDVVDPGPLVDLLLVRAFDLHATDLHLDPVEEGLRVRLRVDGMLHDIVRLPPRVMPNVISRIKLMAGMDITERRVAQDGHIANIAGRDDRDVRVGSGPTIHGERLVLRLMPGHSEFASFEDLGLTEPQAQKIRRLMESPYGMVLSVGPVGSGKSTTMYTCLEHLNDPVKSLATIEDPVERRIEGANQIQVDMRIEFTFVEALRGVLRQDPNVLMIGEIRDAETAQIGCRAAMTGIVVLSTLHANDAASTVDVFHQFGIAPMFIAESVRGIMSQRLLRKVCEHCRETFHPDRSTCEILGKKPDEAESFELARGRGCEHCFYTGYHGRTGVFEIMSISGTVRDAILEGKRQHEIRHMAVEQGMQTLEMVARRKVLDGQTTVEEMHRVLSSLGD
ncbi:MAG: GspE/PulE family protein [Planctomycetes bacterium]|nr:GspE/PulE family protein [Planctomycetota bacterium]